MKKNQLTILTILIMVSFGASSTENHYFIQAMISKPNYSLVSKEQIDDSLTRYRIFDKNEHRQQDFFATSTGLFIVGSVYDLFGNNLSSDLPEINQALAPKKTDSLTYIEQKGGDSLIYIFFDPLCGPCKRLYQTILMSGAEHMTIRWVPVAFQGERSYQDAAAILASENKEDTFHRYMHTQQITPSDDPSYIKLIMRNNKLFTQAGHNGTPSASIITPNKEEIIIDANRLFAMF